MFPQAGKVNGRDSAGSVASLQPRPISPGATMGRWLEYIFSSSKFAEFVFALTPKELRPIAQGCERSELPWGNGSTAHVPQRGSVIGVSRMTQPFQGRWPMRSPTQGSPQARATLGCETQLLRSKDTSSFGVKAPRSTPNLELLILPKPNMVLPANPASYRGVMIVGTPGLGRRVNCTPAVTV